MMYCLMGFIFSCGIGQLFTLCGSCLCINFAAPYSCHARERLRRRYDLPPTFCLPPGIDDCLTHFFCLYCAAHQVRQGGAAGVAECGCQPCACSYIAIAATRTLYYLPPWSPPLPHRSCVSWLCGEWMGPACTSSTCCRAPLRARQVSAPPPRFRPTALLCAAGRPARPPAGTAAAARTVSALLPTISCPRAEHSILRHAGAAAPPLPHIAAARHVPPPTPCPPTPPHAFLQASSRCWRSGARSWKACWPARPRCAAAPGPLRAYQFGAADGARIPAAGVRSRTSGCLLSRAPPPRSCTARAAGRSCAARTARWRWQWRTRRRSWRRAAWRGTCPWRCNTCVLLRLAPPVQPGLVPALWLQLPCRAAQCTLRPSCRTNAPLRRPRRRHLAARRPRTTTGRASRPRRRRLAATGRWGGPATARPSRRCGAGQEVLERCFELRARWPLRRRSPHRNGRARQEMMRAGGGGDAVTAAAAAAAAAAGSGRDPQLFRHATIHHIPVIVEEGPGEGPGPVRRAWSVAY